MKRIFIVGIARSGTTLLQSMVANHPEIKSFPESHFFSKTIHKNKLRRLFHKTTVSQNQIIERFFSRLKKPRPKKKYKGSSWNLKYRIQYLISILDDLAKEDGKLVWVEKTPRHLHYTQLIHRYIPNCFFIHMVREPISNIAALYDASKKYPNAFKQDTVKKAFNRYRKEISIIDKMQNKKNHYIVYYEQLTTNPDKVIQGVCNFIGIEFNENMLQNQKSIDQLKHGKEYWKSNNNQQLKLKNKIEKRLTSTEKRWLKHKIKKLRNIPVLDYYSHT